MKRPPPNGGRGIGNYTIPKQGHVNQSKKPSKRVRTKRDELPSRDHVVIDQSMLLGGSRGQLKAIAGVVRNEVFPENLLVQNRDVKALRLRLSLVGDSYPVSVLLDMSECYPVLESASIKLNMMVLITALKPMGNSFFWSTPGTMVVYAENKRPPSGVPSGSWVESAFDEWLKLPQNSPRDIRGMETLGVPEISELVPLSDCYKGNKPSLSSFSLFLSSEVRHYGPQHVDIVVQDFLSMCNKKAVRDNSALNRCTLHFYDNKVSLARNLLPGQVILLRAQFSIKNGFINLTVKSSIEVLSTNRCRELTEKFGGSWIPPPDKEAANNSEKRIESNDRITSIPVGEAVDSGNTTDSESLNILTQESDNPQVNRENTKESNVFLDEIQQIRANFETTVKFSEELVNERFRNLVESGRNALERITCRLESVERSISSSRHDSQLHCTGSNASMDFERRLGLLEDKLDNYQSRTEKKVLDLTRAVEKLSQEGKKNQAPPDQRRLGDLNYSSVDSVDSSSNQRGVSTGIGADIVSEDPKADSKSYPNQIADLYRYYQSLFNAVESLSSKVSNSHTPGVCHDDLTALANFGTEVSDRLNILERKISSFARLNSNVIISSSSEEEKGVQSSQETSWPSYNRCHPQ